MTFLIDKFFIDEFNIQFGTNITYKEFAVFQKATRAKKSSLGLIRQSSRNGGHFNLSDYDKNEINKMFPNYLVNYIK